MLDNASACDWSEVPDSPCRRYPLCLVESVRSSTSARTVCAFFTLTDRASTMFGSIRACQSDTRSAVGRKLSNEHYLQGSNDSIKLLTRQKEREERKKNEIGRFGL